MVGVGAAAQTNVRLSAVNREGIEAYAMAHNVTFNRAVNDAVRCLLERDCKEWLASVETGTP